VQLLSHVDNMYCQAEILQALLNREGAYFQVAGETVEEKLEKLAQKCGSLQVWCVLQHELGTLNPSIPYHTTHTHMHTDRQTDSVISWFTHMLHSAVQHNGPLYNHLAPPHPGAGAPD